MAPNEQSSRLISLTLLRAWTMLCVVALHSVIYYTPGWGYGGTLNMVGYKTVWQFLHGFNMPTFVFLSGFLYGMLLGKGKYAERLRFMWDKVKRLLGPYLIWGILVMLIFPGKYPISRLWEGWLSHLWFLPMLFGIFVLVTLLRDVLQRPWPIIWVWLALAIAINVCRAYWPDWGHTPSNIFTYLPYFLLGMAVQEPHFRRWLLARNWWGCLAAGVVSLVAYTCMRFNKVQPYELHILLEMLSVCCLVTLLERLLVPLSSLSLSTSQSTTTISSHVMAVVNYIDRASMGIFLVHHIVIAFLAHAFEQKGWMYQYADYMALFFFVVSLAVSIAVTELLRRLHLSKLLLGEK